MVAANKPLNPIIFGECNAQQLTDVRVALLLQARDVGGLRGRRLRRVAEDGPKGPLRNKLFERFINKSYERYLEETGKKHGGRGVSAPAFITWLLDYIKNNPEAILKIVTFIMSLFGL